MTCSTRWRWCRRGVQVVAAGGARRRSRGRTRRLPRVGNTAVRRACRLVPARAGASRGRRLDQSTSAGGAAPVHAGARCGPARATAWTWRASRTMPKAPETRPQSSSSRPQPRRTPPPLALTVRPRHSTRALCASLKNSTTKSAREALRSARVCLLSHRRIRCGHRGGGGSRRVLPPRGEPMWREGDALRSLSRLLRYVGRSDDAMEVGHHRGCHPRVRSPGHELALAYANLSHLHQHLEDDEATVAGANRAIELGDVEAKVYALTNLANAEPLSPGGPATRELERALDLALDGGLGRACRAGPRGLVLVVSLGAQGPGRGRGLGRAVELCTERGLELWRLFAFAFRSRLQLDRGDWSAAADSASVVLRDPRSAPVPRVVALSVAGLVRARRADPEAWPFSTRRGRSPSEPGAAARRAGRGRESGVRLARGPYGGSRRVDRRPTRPCRASARTMDRRRAPLLASAAGLREGRLLEVPDPWAAELDGDLRLAGLAVGPNSTARTRRQSSSRGPTRRTCCCARSSNCRASAPPRRRRSSRGACATAAPAVSRAGRAPRHAPTQPT